MIIRRRGLEEEQSAPTPTYEVHTVTTKCTTTTACANYFKSVCPSTTKSYGFFWIRNGATSITNNQIIYYVINQNSNLCVRRWRDGVLNSTRFGTNYDGIINVGDQFLIVNLTYGAEIYCPSNMGVSVTSSTISATCTNTQQLQDILPSRPNVVFVKTIRSQQYTLAVGVKGILNLRMNYSDTPQRASTGTNYDLRVSEGDQIWIVQYN